MVWSRRKALGTGSEVFIRSGSIRCLLLQNGFPYPALPRSACTIVVELQSQHWVGDRLCLGGPVIEAVYLSKIQKPANLKVKPTTAEVHGHQIKLFSVGLC